MTTVRLPGSSDLYTFSGFDDSGNVLLDPVPVDRKSGAGFMERARASFGGWDPEDQLRSWQAIRGNDNVRLSKNGEVEILENNQWKRVDESGLSVNDIADMIGKAPEVVASGVAAAAAIGTGGLSLPATLALGGMGAAGGAAGGDILRQAADFLLPGGGESKGMLERAQDVGQAALYGGVGEIGGQLLLRGAGGMLRKVGAPIAEAATGVSAKNMKDLAGEAGERIYPLIGRTDEVIGQVADDAQTLINQYRGNVSSRYQATFDEIFPTDAIFDTGKLKQSLTSVLKNSGIMDESGNLRRALPKTDWVHPKTGKKMTIFEAIDSVQTVGQANELKQMFDDLIRWGNQGVNKSGGKTKGALKQMRGRVNSQIKQHAKEAGVLRQFEKMNADYGSAMDKIRYLSGYFTNKTKEGTARNISSVAKRRIRETLQDIATEVPEHASVVQQMDDIVVAKSFEPFIQANKMDVGRGMQGLLAGAAVGNAPVAAAGYLATRPAVIKYPLYHGGKLVRKLKGKGSPGRAMSDIGDVAPDGPTAGGGMLDVDQAASRLSRTEAENPYFDHWFGKSAVRAEDGTPKRVYRGDYRGDKVGNQYRVVDGDEGGSGGVYWTDDPEQVKSAIGNSGKYDPNNADIRKSRARQTSLEGDLRANGASEDYIAAQKEFQAVNDEYDTYSDKFRNGEINLEEYAPILEKFNQAKEKSHQAYLKEQNRKPVPYGEEEQVEMFADVNAGRYRSLFDADEQPFKLQQQTAPQKPSQGTLFSRSKKGEATPRVDEKTIREIRKVAGRGGIEERRELARLLAERNPGSTINEAETTNSIYVRFQDGGEVRLSDHTSYGRNKPTHVITHNKTASKLAEMLERAEFAAKNNITNYKDLAEQWKQRQQREYRRSRASNGKTIQGKTAKAYGPNGEPYQFRYRLVELDDLVASHDRNLRPNKDFDQRLQPRDRTKHASRDQINEIVNKFVPQKLVHDSPSIQHGAPIVGADNMVESGNARVISLRELFGRRKAKWSAYVDEIKGKAEQFGLKADDLDAMDKPVLVRERLGDTDRAEFARLANEDDVAEMADVEIAMATAERLPDNQIASLEIPDSPGRPERVFASSAALTKALGASMPASKRAGIIDKNGGLSRTGRNRLKSAIFAKTYGGEDGTKLLDEFVESDEPALKGLENAIFNSLPAVAKLEAMVRSGATDSALSIADDIKKVARKRLELAETGLSVNDYLAQQSFFERELTPTQEALLSYVGANSRSAKNIATLFHEYANKVIEIPPPSQSSMFDVERPTQNQLLTQVLTEMGEEGTKAGRQSAKAAAEAIEGAPEKAAAPKPKYEAPEDSPSIPTKQPPKATATDAEPVTPEPQPTPAQEPVQQAASQRKQPNRERDNAVRIEAVYDELARARKRFPGTEIGVMQKHEPGVRGSIDVKTGAVLINPHEITSPQELREVLLHEIIGHKGLRGTVGKDLDRLLGRVQRRYPDRIRNRVKSWGISRSEAAEEVLAEIAEQDLSSGFTTEIIGRIREILSKKFDVQLKDKDVRFLLGRSKRHAEGKAYKAAVPGAAAAIGVSAQ